MGACGSCGGPVARHFRFCPWCGRAQRRKLTEFFLGYFGKALRVSRYLVEEERQVRFSVWNESGEAEAAVSLDEAESDRLADFLAQTSMRAAPPPPEQTAARPDPPPLRRGS